MSELAFLTAVALSLAPIARVAAQLPDPSAFVQNTLVSASDGYARNDINSVSFSRSNIISRDGFQYLAYYDGGFRNTIHVARRAHGTGNWTVLDTGLEAVNVTDSHDNVNLAIDGHGYMHIAWGVHNNPIRYGISAMPVNDQPFTNDTLSFSQPAYWAGTAATNDNAVTYPEFYNIPNSDDLLFTYRQGSSGNGDQWFARYNAAAGTFEKNLVVAGSQTSVNAYFNRFNYDSKGVLRAT